MEVSQQTIKYIRRAGAVLLLAGLAPIAWVLVKSQVIPNYLRIVAMLPFFFGVPMFSVNDYFGGWTSLEPREKGRAIAWLFAPIMGCVAALLWYLNDPAAKA
jgi:hypothetical protein